MTLIIAGGLKRVNFTSPGISMYPSISYMLAFGPGITEVGEGQKGYLMNYICDLT